MMKRSAAVAKPSRGSVRASATRPLWRPGSTPPAHLNNTLPGDFGFDPLGLGVNAERLTWFAEAERVHCRWAMLGVAGVLAQELVAPDQFWYTSSAKMELPFPIMGLVAFEFWAMHFVEIKRWQDLWNPNSVNKDPLFPSNKIADHEPGYPGLTLFVPGPMAEMKVKEIKNGRLAMLAYIGFIMGAQVTGKNPLAALADHVADPFGTTIFSKAAIIPGQAIVPACAIPPSVVYEGITIPTPCFLSNLWP